jgi:hypothetical protein
LPWDLTWASGVKSQSLIIYGMDQYEIYKIKKQLVLHQQPLKIESESAVSTPTSVT